MKVTINKQMDLLELLNWLSKNYELPKNTVFEPHSCYSDDQYVYIKNNGSIKINNVYYYDIFDVDVEKNINENTILPRLVVIRNQFFPSNRSTTQAVTLTNKSIRNIINQQPKSSSYEYKEIYLLEEEGLGPCIWKNGKLL